MSKRCGSCRTLKPTDQFVRDKQSRDGLNPRCKACRAIRDRGELTPAQAVRAPDPTPARALRHALNECRDKGLEFEAAWPVAVEQALNTAGGDGWSTTFAWSRQNWRSAYERRPPGRGERVRIFPGDLTAA